MSSTMLSNLLYQLPLLAVYIVGLVISLVRWQRHPKVSALVMTSMIVLLVALIGPQFAYRFVGYRLSNLVTIGGYLLHAAGIGMWLAGVFSMRSEPSQQYPMNPGQPGRTMRPPPIPPTFG